MRTYRYDQQHEAVRELLTKDCHFESLVRSADAIIFGLDDDYFLALANTIIAQQLSSKVAIVIANRLRAAFDHPLTPDDMISASTEELRALGLSRQKITYLKSLSEHVKNGFLDFPMIKTLPDEDIIRILTRIKGIGRWTAEMFLIFSLGREDVFAIDDLGLRNAVRTLYRNEALTPQEILEISKRWSPYRSVASHYLWHIWDHQENQI